MKVPTVYGTAKRGVVSNPAVAQREPPRLRHAFADWSRVSDLRRQQERLGTSPFSGLIVDFDPPLCSDLESVWTRTLRPRAVP